MNKDVYLAYFLTGLWEGDGHIGVPTTRSKPYFAIIFHVKDEPLAKNLQKYLGGTLRYKLANNSIVLTIRAQHSLLNVVLLLHGKLRSPKIYEFNELIKWLNLKLDLILPLSEIDNSNLGVNSWLAGFIDADGGFKIRYQEKKIDEKTNKILKKNRIALSFVLEPRKNHSKTNTSFSYLMESICSFLNLPNSVSKVYESKHNQKSYYKIEISSLSRLQILYKYLLQYPLLSSKYNDFLDWSKALELIQKDLHLTNHGKRSIFELKQQINNKRQNFNWDHLEFFKKNL